MDGQLREVLVPINPFCLKRHKFECQSELRPQVGQLPYHFRTTLMDRSFALAGYDWQDEILSQGKQHLQTTKEQCWDFPGKCNTVCSLIHFLALHFCPFSAPFLSILSFLIPSFFPSLNDVTNVTDKPKWITPSFPPCRTPVISHQQFWHFQEEPEPGIPREDPWWANMCHTSHHIRWHIKSRLLISPSGHHNSSYSENCNAMKVTLG